MAIEQHVLNSIDTAVKLIQAEELRRSGFASMAISYPARDLDPTEEFLPLVPPFVFLSGGQWQSIFSSFYAVLIAPLLPLEEQRRYGEAFRRVYELRAAVRRTADLAADTAATLTTGLTAGVLLPPDTPGSPDTSGTPGSRSV